MFNFVRDTVPNSSGVRIKCLGYLVSNHPIWIIYITEEDLMPWILGFEPPKWSIYNTEWPTKRSISI